MNESPGDSPPPPPGSLVPPAHGNGLLRRGSLPGNTPGTGRPPSAIRERLRGSFDERVKVLEEIADKADASAADRLKAIDLMGKYGLGKQVDADDVRGRLRTTLDLLERELPSDVFQRVYPLLKEVWK